MSDNNQGVIGSVHEEEEKQPEQQQDKENNSQNQEPSQRSQKNQSSGQSQPSSGTDKDDQTSNNNDGDYYDDELDEQTRKALSPENKVRLNYYRWMFFFFFFHFFTFIVTSDIINEFSVFLSDEQVEDSFNELYPNIIPSIKSQLSFVIIVMLFFIGAFILTFRYTMKVFNIMLISFIVMFLAKITCQILTLTVEPEFNEKLSEWYSDVSSDVQNKCGPSQYDRCRITFAWNFFKWEVIFDLVVTTILFGIYLRGVRLYKIHLVDEYIKLNETEESQSQNQQNDVSAISQQQDKSNIQLNEPNQQQQQVGGENNNNYWKE